MRPEKPEVLAPAGSAEALSAAIGAGADAVYFGLSDFNARIRARNFELGDLPDLLRDLRRWGVKSYLVFNTLVFAEELAAARDVLEAIALAGPDGIIVQDPGVIRLIRMVAPHLPVHASTQMTVASADGVRLAARLGASRVILARELSLREMARIRSEVETELEVFVHGALCVSYSGQCLSSEAWGGRSANRGQCAQACRLPYDLVVDGRKRDLGDRAYLLSPRDLEGVERIPELIDLGISAFKIEGRMKSAEYVATSTALYRAAVDRAWDRRADTSLTRLVDEARQIFSRGASEGFLGGVNHQVLVDGSTRAHRGLLAGTVRRLETDREGRGLAVILEERRPKPGERPVQLKAGDGLLLAVTPLEEDEVGGRVLSLEPTGNAHEQRIRFAREAMPDLSRVVPGTPVYRTSDPQLQGRLRADLRRPEDRRRVVLSARVEGAVGTRFRLSLTDPEGRVATAESTLLCGEARNRAFDDESARAILDRLGGTRYRLGAVAVEGDSFFLPVSEINAVRREAIARMEALRGELPAEGRWVVSSRLETGPTGFDEELSPVLWAVRRADSTDAPVDSGRSSALPDRADRPGGATASPPAGAESFEEQCLVLCRDRAQLRGALEAGARRIILDFLDLVGLREASEELRRHGIRRTLALPRVQKAGEERIESFFLGLEPEEVLVRSLGGIQRLATLRGARASTPEGSPSQIFPAVVGDVSLNAVNPGSIETLVGLGLARLAPGLDLNGEQLESLVRQTDAKRLEIPVHHHLPVFHTEHCVFAAFLSDGADFRSCGRPCDRHRIELKDRIGQGHPVVADVGCRNTIFGARPQSMLAHLAALRAAGVRHFRLELMTEDAAGARRVIELYREVWAGRRDGRAALGILHAESAYGLSVGAPEPARTISARPAGARAKPAGKGLARPGKGAPGRGTPSSGRSDGREVASQRSRGANLGRSRREGAHASNAVRTSTRPVDSKRPADRSARRVRLDDTSAERVRPTRGERPSRRSGRPRDERPARGRQGRPDRSP